MIKVKNIEQVVNYQLCTGCGACEAAEPGRYAMTDVADFGYRPQLIENAKTTTGDAFKACPGHTLAHTYDRDDPDLIKTLEDCWGPVYGVWEGYARDDDIRFKGSSGGAATALSLFGLEHGYGDSVYHIGSDPKKPYASESKKSTTKQHLVDNAGSRYAPASPCAPLKDLRTMPGKAVFVGKPCDVAAVNNWERLSESHQDKIGIKIGFFCAGAPSTKGNAALLKKEGVTQLERIKALKFRGEGWPGLWRANYKDDKGVDQKAELSYQDSWGFLQRFRQWRCYICPDHTAEFADIAVGDPWYREVQEGEAGKSLIVARTKKGMDYLLQAEKENYVVLESKDASLLPRSQPNLIKARGDVWARLLVLRLFGAPVPKYLGFKMFKFWISHLTFKDKLSSFYGTATRIKRKALRKTQNIID